MSNTDNRTERELTAKDVKRLANLTYRQLNDWEKKGLLPEGRKDKSQWRRFTLKEIFVLTVSSTIRKKFGVPLDSLQWFQSVMLQEKANHFVAATEIIAELGVPVFIMTDLESTFVMDSVFEFADLLVHGFFGGTTELGYIFLKVNGIVNRVLTCLKDAPELEEHHVGYRLYHRAKQETHVRNQEELELVRLIRSGAFTRITVDLDGEKLKALTAEEEFGITDPGKIAEVLKERDYMDVDIKKHNGEIRRLTKKLKFKSSGQGFIDFPKGEHNVVRLKEEPIDKFKGFD